MYIFRIENIEVVPQQQEPSRCANYEPLRNGNVASFHLEPSIAHTRKTTNWKFQYTSSSV